MNILSNNISLLKQLVNKIRDGAVYVLKNSFIALYLHNTFYRIKNKKRFINEVNRRSEISIFHYTELSKPLPFYPLERVKDSNYYGHFHWLKKYSGINKLSHSIEHGLYLGKYVPKATFFRTTKSVITLSENRKKHLLLSNVKKPIYPIGPYIHYAESILKLEEINELKVELGKTLLVFPSHSIKEFNVKFDVENFISEISSISKNYETVMICLFYQDILDNRFLDLYQKRGFKVVTAGHRYDLNFVSRLKSIIMLSDFTMSNNVGTHTGYCIYLNKPHYIFNQNINYLDDKGIIPINYRNESQLNSLEHEKSEIISVFSELSTNIAENQRDIIDKYWGFSSIKSPSEIKNLLK